MILTLHIDNRIISLACYEGMHQAAFASIGTESGSTAQEYAVRICQVLRFAGADTDALEGAVISSVVPQLSHTLAQSAQLLCGCAPLRVGAGIRTGLNLRVENAAAVGSDFIATAVAALEEFQPPLIIIHLAGAVTFTAIDEAGVLTGRSILPGIESSLEHLCQASAQLPQVDFVPQPPLIAKGTADAMRSGIFYGSLAAIEGMCLRYQEQLGREAPILITGSLAETICRYARVPMACREHLLHDGLALIYAKNR